MLSKQNLVDSLLATGAAGSVSIPDDPQNINSYLVPLVAGVIAPIIKQGGQLILENLNNKIRNKTAPDVTPPFTTHFSIDEFHCNDGTKVPVHLYPNIQKVMDALETLRVVTGPLIINSGYRTPKHNKAIGGAKGSYHMIGLAADLKPLECSVDQLQYYIVKMRKEGRLPEGGLGIYKTFIHFDLGPKRTWYKN